MGKVYKNKQCINCGNLTEVIESFGKNYCKKCYKDKPKRGYGHSGMIPQKGLKPDTPLPIFKGLELLRTTKGNKLFATLFCEHYPQSKGILGRQLNYFVSLDGEVIGIIGANSPPLNYKKFREFFDCDNEKLFLNNNVYRLIKHDKNLGTQVLKIFRKKVKEDYKKKYGDELIGLVTFVEPPRNGALYKADNWEYLGKTQGKKVTLRKKDRDNWQNKGWTIGVKKHIFVYKY